MNVVGPVIDVQTAFYRAHAELFRRHRWPAVDGRLQVFHRCAHIAENARLSLALLFSAYAHGIEDKDWWATWAFYDPDRSLGRVPNFKGFVDGQVGQFSLRVREHLLYATQVYAEAFLRQLGRQFGIDPKDIWTLKRQLLEEALGFSKDDLTSIAVYQHLRNSMHNGGVHHNPNQPSLTFEIGGCRFAFNEGQPIGMSWEHVRVLPVALCETLFQICQHPNVTNLETVETRNVVVIVEDEEP